MLKKRRKCTLDAVMRKGCLKRQESAAFLPGTEAIEIRLRNSQSWARKPTNQPTKNKQKTKTNKNSSKSNI